MSTVADLIMGRWHSWLLQTPLLRAMLGISRGTGLSWSLDTRARPPAKKKISWIESCCDEATECFNKSEDLVLDRSMPRIKEAVSRREKSCFLGAVPRERRLLLLSLSAPFPFSIRKLKGWILLLDAGQARNHALVLPICRPTLKTYRHLGN